MLSLFSRLMDTAVESHFRKDPIQFSKRTSGEGGGKAETRMARAIRSMRQQPVEHKKKAER
jgi:hypothetical protein